MERDAPTLRRAAALAAGAVLWKCVEYFAHRFVLHGVFPELTDRDSHHG
jgi:hypothetical protein